MYLDTSVLVKLFIPESDSEYYGRLVDGQAVCSSVLAYTEFWSALLGKERAGGLDTASRDRSWEAFSNHVMDETIELVAMGPAVFKRANRILEQCQPRISLRTLDALHLACADQTQDWPMATQDQRMRQVALLLGFPLAPPPP